MGAVPFCCGEATRWLFSILGLSAMGSLNPFNKMSFSINIVSSWSFLFFCNCLSFVLILTHLVHTCGLLYRRCIPADRPEHRRDLPRDKQFHHIRWINDDPAVLWDSYMDPNEQASVPYTHAGKSDKLKHTVYHRGKSVSDSLGWMRFDGISAVKLNTKKPLFGILYATITWFAILLNKRHLSVILHHPLGVKM